jgi:hypothetical protein
LLMSHEDEALLGRLPGREMLLLLIRVSSLKESSVAVAPVGGIGVQACRTAAGSLSIAGSSRSLCKLGRITLAL